MSRLTVLVIDDEDVIVQLIRRVLRDEDYDVVSARDGADGLVALARQAVDVALIDLKLPGMDGLEVLQRVRKDHPDVECIILTAHGDLAAADRAMQIGAVGFISKPFDTDDFKRRLKRMAAVRALSAENERLRSLASAGEPLLVGSSKAMKKVRQAIEKVRGEDVTVLILGESGTGKEVAARAIHVGGPRRDQPFVPVDCAAMSPTLIESELFGHVRGAFTGADRDKAGLLTAAGRGTIFLDEVAEVPPAAQAKLLRAIQEREVRAVGATSSERFNGRLIAATNRDLEAMIKAGEFREDLFYRLNVFTIRMPSLRERSEDVAELAGFVLERLNRRRGLSKKILPATLKMMEGYAWPGNVRELENALESAFVMSGESSIESAHLPMHTRSAAREPAADGLTLDAWIKRAIEAALARTGGNIPSAAKLLAVSKPTLYRHIRTFRIDPAKF